MASKLEETLVHRMVIRGDYEQRIRDTLATMQLSKTLEASGRRCLRLQIACWLDADERCNEAARELADSVVVELAPRETFRGKAIAV